jgi:hypothetical protein
MAMFDLERLLDAIRWQESRGNPNAVSPAGARGPYQIMDFNTAEAIGGSGKVPIGGATPIPRGMLEDEDRSRQFAREAITGLMKQYGGDTKKALAAYNAGPGSVASGRLKPETVAYVPGVLNRYDHEVAAAANDPASPTPERQRFDEVAMKLGAPKDMTEGLDTSVRSMGGIDEPIEDTSMGGMFVKGAEAPEGPPPVEMSTGDASRIQDPRLASMFLRGQTPGGPGIMPVEQPQRLTPPTATEPGAEDTDEIPPDAPNARAVAGLSGDREGNSFINRLIPGDEKTSKMGLFERMRQPGNREMFLRLGAGIAGGKGWADGLGRGFEGAADALDTNRRLDVLEGEQSLKNLGPQLAYKYWLGKGKEPNEALLRAVKPELFGEWDVVQTGETPAGAKVFREHNKATGEWRDPPAAAAQSANPNQEVEGPELLNSIEDPNDRKIVEKLSTYDWNPADISIRGKHPRSWYMGMAQRVNPGLDVTNYVTRFAAKKEFQTGTGPNSPANMITAGNTAIKHLGEMSDQAEKLDNFNTGLPGNRALNWARNEYKKSSGTATELTAFEAAREKYVDEATKFYRGTGGNESDILRGIELLSEAQSLPELRAAVQENVHLMESKIEALQDRWHQAVPGAGDFQIVHPSSQAALDRIHKRFENLQGPAETGVAPPPPPDAPEVVPAGMDPDDWKYMNAEQRKLFGG